jgi:site-specific recombinase XerD
MHQLVQAVERLPTLVAAGDERARTRFVEFFASNIRNPHTRRAYAGAIGEFLEWCRRRGVKALDEVRPLHVAAWIERQTRRYSAPTVKQQLAAVRHLFDWLVTGQVVPVNPASSVRGPRHSVKKSKTPVLELAEAHALLDAIDTATHARLRDRALIGLMVYTFARIDAA